MFPGGNRILRSLTTFCVFAVLDYFLCFNLSAGKE